MKTEQDRVDLSDEQVHWDLGSSQSYGDYLHLKQILSAQHPVSGEHDEMLFVIIHQASELWIKLCLHELNAACEHIRRDDLGPCFKMLARLSRIQAQLTQSWEVLSTMTPFDYSSFRNQLGKASGFQSYQYRMLEFALGNKNAEMIEVHKRDPEIYQALQRALVAPSIYDESLRLLSRRGYDIPREYIDRDFSQPYTPDNRVAAAWLSVYHHVKEHWDLYELAEKLVDLDYKFQHWRFSHVKTVERIIGYKRGTGGTAGVAYLTKALELRAFPGTLDYQNLHLRRRPIMKTFSAAMTAIIRPMLFCPLLAVAAPESDGREETLRKGVQLHDAGNYDSAIKVYQSLLKENPDDAVALYEMAFSYMAMKDFDKCIDAAQRSAKLPSEAQPRALSTLASCYDDAGRIKDALGTFERAMGLFPKDPMLNFNYAITLMRQGEPNKAREHLRTTIENAPPYPSPYRTYAVILQEEGNGVGALFMNLRLIMLEGQSPRVVDAAKEIAQALTTKKTADGKMQINVNLLSESAAVEGEEFQTLTVALAASVAAMSDKLPAETKEADRFVASLQAFFAVGTELAQSEIKERFVWKHAAQPVLDLGKEEVLPPFLYHVAYLARMDGAEQWLRANEAEVNKLVAVLQKRPPPQ